MLKFNVNFVSDTPYILTQLRSLQKTYERVLRLFYRIVVSGVKYIPTSISTVPFLPFNCFAIDGQTIEVEATLSTEEYPELVDFTEETQYKTLAKQLEKVSSSS